MTILVTGAAGGLAGILVDRLAEGHRLVGVDPRPMPYGRNFPGRFHQVDYNHRKMTEIFRRDRFDALIHLGRVAATSSASKSVRYNLNVLGTRNLLHLSSKFGVRRVIVFSTFHVYGAHQHNHLHIAEDEPLRASQIFPELSDSIELDNFARTFCLQFPEVKTLILRPVNVVGARVRNDITRLLRSDYCPTLLGYDPFLQFIHERDVATALQLCLESEKSGVYNVAGEGLVSYSRAIELAGSKAVPIPHFFVYPLVGALHGLGLRLPKHLVDYFRYSVVVKDAAFRAAFGFQPAVTTREALGTIRSVSGS